MHTPTGESSGLNQPGSERVTWYHWVVVVIASFGWLFDCMDQRIFVLARESALKALVPVEEVQGSVSELDPAEQEQAVIAARDKLVKNWAGWATAIMMIGWATGGIFFGTMSDRWGRVKTMIATLVVYSGFTGLSGFSRSPEEFMIYRFLVGLGVGGMFGAATTLVAESVPSSIRAVALGMLQALSAIGNILGSIFTRFVQPGAEDVAFGFDGWRLVFFIGIIPSLLVIPIIFILREPDRWKEARRRAREHGDDASKQMGSIPDLFRHPTWRRHTLVGVTLGLSGMAGLWGIGFFSPELITAALKGEPQTVIDTVRAWGLALQDVGAFFGMVAFTFVATRFGRKPAFFIAYLLCLATTMYVFNFLRSGSDAYWMLPMMGFAQLSVFGGYSIYFPELFPTRLRGTGVSFCYNTVRYLAAGFPPMLMALNSMLIDMEVEEPFRKAATYMCAIFALGLFALIWAPETKGRPLPED